MCVEDFFLTEGSCNLDKDVPFVVTILLGRCFVIRLTFNTGHDMKFLCLMDLKTVDGVGLKSSPDMYCARSLFVWSTRMKPFIIYFGEVEVGVRRG